MTEYYRFRQRTKLGNAVIDQIEKGVAFLPKLKVGLFTNAPIGNIDVDPS